MLSSEGGARGGHVPLLTPGEHHDQTWVSRRVIGSSCATFWRVPSAGVLGRPARQIWRVRQDVTYARQEHRACSGHSRRGKLPQA